MQGIKVEIRGVAVVSPPNARKSVREILAHAIVGTGKMGKSKGIPQWPREESNLRARIRSPSLYPLSYGAPTISVASAAEAGLARLRSNALGRSSR
jgi:hypothetical protein